MRSIFMLTGFIPSGWSMSPQRFAHYKAIAFHRR